MICIVGHARHRDLSARERARFFSLSLLAYGAFPAVAEKRKEEEYRPDERRARKKEIGRIGARTAGKKTGKEILTPGVHSV